MWQYTLKIILSAVVLVTVAELAKRSSFFGCCIGVTAAHVSSCLCVDLY